MPSGIYHSNKNGYYVGAGNYSAEKKSKSAEANVNLIEAGRKTNRYENTVSRS